MKTKNMFVFICSPSLPLPSVLSSSIPPLLRVGREGERAGSCGGGQPSAHTGFPNPITELIVNFHQKIGTFQQMENFLLRLFFSIQNILFPENYLDK